MENEEVWIGQVLFNFEDPETMLDKLTALPFATLSRLRHLRIVGDPLLLSYGHCTDIYYYPSSILTLLPGLRLDTLTVIGVRSAAVNYQILDRLIYESCGWKELCFISPTSKLLAFERCIPFRLQHRDKKYWYWRQPQPAHWQTFLEERDGCQSNPSVVIYRSTVPDSPNSVLDANFRVGFEQKVPKDTWAKEAFGLIQDAELMADGERNKELMVIVKRGTGVDYEHKRDSPFLTSDIRRAMPGKGWEDIRYECINRPARLHPNDRMHCVMS